MESVHTLLRKCHLLKMFQEPAMLCEVLRCRSLAEWHLLAIEVFGGKHSQIYSQICALLFTNLGLQEGGTEITRSSTWLVRTKLMARTRLQALPPTTQSSSIFPHGTVLRGNLFSVYEFCASSILSQLTYTRIGVQFSLGQGLHMLNFVAQLWCSTEKPTQRG